MNWGWILDPFRHPPRPCCRHEMRVNHQNGAVRRPKHRLKIDAIEDGFWIHCGTLKHIENNWTARKTMQKSPEKPPKGIQNDVKIHPRRPRYAQREPLVEQDELGMDFGSISAPSLALFSGRNASKIRKIYDGTIDERIDCEKVPEMMPT